MRSSRVDGLVGHTSYGHRIYFVLLGRHYFLQIQLLAVIPLGLSLARRDFRLR